MKVIEAKDGYDLIAQMVNFCRESGKPGYKKDIGYHFKDGNRFSNTIERNGLFLPEETQLWNIPLHLMKVISHSGDVDMTRAAVIGELSLADKLEGKYKPVKDLEELNAYDPAEVCKDYTSLLGRVKIGYSSELIDFDRRENGFISAHFNLSVFDPLGKYIGNFAPDVSEAIAELRDKVKKSPYKLRTSFIGATAFSQLKNKRVFSSDELQPYEITKAGFDLFYHPKKHTEDKRREGGWSEYEVHEISLVANMHQLYRGRLDLDMREFPEEHFFTPNLNPALPEIVYSEDEPPRVQF